MQLSQRHAISDARITGVVAMAEGLADKKMGDKLRVQRRVAGCCEGCWGAMSIARGTKAKDKAQKSQQEVEDASSVARGGGGGGGCWR